VYGPARRGELDGVAQDVADHLLEADRVGGNDDRVAVERHVHAQSFLPGRRLRGVHRLPHGLAHVEVALPQRDLSLGNAGYIQQIVHQPCQVADLTLHRAVRPGHHLGRRLEP